MSRSVGWRSTTLGMVEKHCPRVLDFLASDAPYDRSVFSVGVAAHAVLEEIGKESARRKDWLMTEEAGVVAEKVCRELIQAGRRWEDKRDPPMPSDTVFRGRDLALGFHSDTPLPPDGQYEIGIAVSRDWQPCPYDEGAWVRCLVDMRSTRQPSWADFEDEDGASGPILLVRDYKTAWSTDERELGTIQRKLQAVLGWIHWGKHHDALRLEVVNVRARKTYDTTVFPESPEGAAVMARWRRDVEIEIAAREAQMLPDGSHPAVPGAGCVGCPFLHACEAGKQYAGAVFGSDNPREMAIAYAYAQAVMESLSGPLKQATEEEPIEIPGGIVGTIAEEQRALKADAYQQLADVWLRKAHPATLEAAMAQVPGLFKALGLGVANVEKLLRFLYKGGEDEREKRQKLLWAMMGKKVTRKFGLHKPKERKAEE